MTRTRWEYMIHTAVWDSKILNALGKEGWELVVFFPPTNNYPGAATFKRPIKQEK